MYIQKPSSGTAPEGRGAFLALPAQLEAVLPEPRRPPGAALGLVELVALAQAAGALAWRERGQKEDNTLMNG